ncbi:MAG: ATP-binding protein [bacterium]
MPSSPRNTWRWRRWSLATQLPLLTAAVVVFVLVLSLTLTYRALLESRSEALHERLQGFLAPLLTASDQSGKLRKQAMRALAEDPALQAALEAYGAPHAPSVDTSAQESLEKLRVPSDSGLPIELWTTNGHRVAHVGTDVAGDSVAARPPEMRPMSGKRLTQVPNGDPGLDSVELGALYPSQGHVYWWAVGPITRNGQRIGYVAQQRQIFAGPQTSLLIRGLSGEEMTLYLRNATDDFWTSLEGKPIAAPTRRDTMLGGFTARHGDGPLQIGREGKVPNAPYVIVLEAPTHRLFDAPRATIRRIALLSLILLIGGVIAAWVLSRQITRPLVALTTAAEAIAEGSYDRRVESVDATSDEVLRLGASFNRMASAVQASRKELASQVEEAVATSEQLEQTNVRLKHASTSADEARDAALNANRAKSDFLAVMSHELRTPLNAIGGYTEILQLGIYGELNDAQKGALIRVARSQQTLLSLINDVLNFAKLEAGEVRYSITNVVLAPVLSAIEELIAPQLRDRKQQYLVRPLNADIVVRADSEKLQQILINLLSNAIKYTPEGGSIQVWSDFDDGTASVHVTDTGIGIAPDRLEKIFDPFIQVGRALNRPHDGVGLGLSISRDLATAMGGALSVTSILGQGSTFTLTLERALETAKSA